MKRTLHIHLHTENDSAHTDPNNVCDSITTAVKRLQYYSDDWESPAQCFILDTNGNTIGEAEYGQEQE